MDSDLKNITYAANFNRDMDDNTKKIVTKYHPHKEFILMSQIQGSNESETCKLMSFLLTYYVEIYHKFIFRNMLCYVKCKFILAH